MRTRWKTIAHVVKARATSGEVVVGSVHGLPPLLAEGMEVALVPPALKAPRFLTVSRTGASDGISQLISFEGVDTLSAAKELVGRTILARAGELPHGIEAIGRDALVGARVEDLALGYLGVIEEILIGRGQDVFVLAAADCKRLIPVRGEFFKGRSNDGSIILDLPEGSILTEGE
ncbi:16S rRNA processing protein RimM [Coriobacteriales bacterium OH1046]|nr:16S rRNA processing protein RimM [Coriobacteriales bacterium OH1046]